MLTQAQRNSFWQLCWVKVLFAACRGNSKCLCSVWQMAGWLIAPFLHPNNLALVLPASGGSKAACMPG